MASEVQMGGSQPARDGSVGLMSSQLPGIVKSLGRACTTRTICTIWLCVCACVFLTSANAMARRKVCARARARVYVIRARVRKSLWLTILFPTFLEGCDSIDMFSRESFAGYADAFALFDRCPKHTISSVSSRLQCPVAKAAAG